MRRARSSNVATSSHLSSMIAVLASPVFVAAVTVLLLNDWVLKAAYGNWLTGKLSDFAGLAAFTMFFAAVIPVNRRVVFLLTGAAFVFWKSPLSEPALNVWNAMVSWPLTRVVDYSDWVALNVLVPTYMFVRRVQGSSVSHRIRLVHHGVAVASGVAALVAFTATSILGPTPIDWAAHPITAGRTAVLIALDSVHVSVSKRKIHPGPDGADTLVVDIRYPPERWLSVTIELRDAPPDRSQLRAIALWPHGPQPSAEGMQRAFAAQVVEPVQQWLTRHSGDGR